MPGASHAGNHPVIAIDKNWVCPSKFFDGRSDLSDLGFRMSAGIAGVRNEVFKRAVLDTQDPVAVYANLRRSTIII
jgi:hypothetical protein